MQIYLAGVQEGISTILSETEREHATRLWERYVKNRLFSYYTDVTKSTFPSRALAQALRLGMSMFLDSGAFSFAKSKMPMPSPEEYAAYCLSTKDVWALIASQDTILGDKTAEKTNANYKLLRSFGVDAKPVFHWNETDNWLQTYIEEADEYGRYLLLGGMVGVPESQLIPRLDYVFNKYLTDTEGFPRLKLHAFGVTSESLLRRFPWASSDSSSYLHTGRYGACMFRRDDGSMVRIFFSRAPRKKKPSDAHFDELPPSTQDLVRAWLAEAELTPEQVAKSYAFRNVMNARTYASLSDVVPDRYQRERL